MAQLPESLLGAAFKLAYFANCYLLRAESMLHATPRESHWKK